MTDEQNKDDDTRTDMDLINMVQQARMMFDSQTKPSDVTAVYWIEVKCQGDDCQKPTARAGQWVLDIDATDADAAWDAIKTATEAGELGYKSKISTASRSGKGATSRTIAVRTYDSADAADKQQILKALQGLKLGDDWRYEVDQSQAI